MLKATMDILVLEPMDTQDLDILDIMGPGLMAIHTPMALILTPMEMVPTLTPMDPTPTMLLARGLLMLSPVLILTMVPMDILDMDILDSMGPDLMAMVPILTPTDPTPTTLLARGLLILMLSLLLILTMVPMDIQDMDILDSMEPDLMDMLPILTPMDHMPMDPTPSTLLARGLLMLSPPLIPIMGTMDMLLLTVMDMLPDHMDMLPMLRIPMDPDTMDTDGNYIPPSANNQPPCMLPDSEEDLKFSCGRCH